ncbi:putative membrane-bound redox modulator Alx [Parachlamydia sp. AcF125]|nr:putative membrane-bound redox modulator Alx [Parachlamydia sp. AcF125]
MEAGLWIVFISLIVILLILDLGVFHRNSHAISTREALTWSFFWIMLALVFNVFIFFLYENHWFRMGLNEPILKGKEAALQFLAGYVIEKSLSLDNIVVIALVFSYFKVPSIYQHRVLFWGILGVLVLRLIMILGGIALVSLFHWINYIFGAFLIFTAIKMLVIQHDRLETKNNLLVKLAYRYFPITSEFHGNRFFVRSKGHLQMTPLFLVLLVIEGSDVLFAIDSIPAIFAVTKEPFIIFTSNIFAILGLRSLYFALASMMQKFAYLKASLALLMAFVGMKMLMANYYHIPIGVSLAIIGGILFVGILASIFAQEREGAPFALFFAGVQESLLQVIIKHARKMITLVVGSTILLIGITLLVLPGPAFIVIPLGVAILAKEFLWAKKLYKKIKGYSKHFINKVSERITKMKEDK